MWVIISDEQAITHAQSTLTTALQQGMKERIHCTVSGAGNRYEDDVAYDPALGVWYSYQLQEKKHFNGFGTEKPKAGSKVALQSEINLPRSGVSKAMAAAFAGDGQRVALIHRGKIRGGKALFFEHYQGKTIEVDGETCALITILGRPDCAADVCAFVHAVQQIKTDIKRAAT